MFENLTEKFIETFRTLSGKTQFTESILDELCRQLRRNLIEADVNVKVVKDFVASIREKALSSTIEKSFTPEQKLIKIVFNELTQLMGESSAPLNLKTRPPAVILMCGLQGTGKTTSTAKLADHLIKKHKKSVMLASVDIYRPAAIEQLKIASSGTKATWFESSITDSARMRAVLAKEEAIKANADVLILDTAGRLHIDEQMMEELQDISSELQPIETLLVLDAMTGQDSVHIATEFQSHLNISGVLLTKMDGDARGGAALSVKSVTGCPIKYIGVGEKVSDLEVFHPDRMASRILDMGDLLSLAEKASTEIDPNESLKLARKLKKNELTLADFYTHLQQIKKMGSFENLMKFLPGMGQLKKQLKTMTPPDTELKKIEAIILSMTPEERVDHTLLNGSRRKRIAFGSGTKVEDINRLVKQFLEAKKMMTRLSKKSGMGKRPRMW